MNSNSINDVSGTENNICDDSLFLRTLEAKLGCKLDIFKQSLNDCNGDEEDKSLYEFCKMCKIAAGEMDCTPQESAHIVS